MPIIQNCSSARSFTNNRKYQKHDLEILNSIFSNVLTGSERRLTSVALLNRFGDARHVLIAPDEQLEDMNILSESALGELRKTRKIMRTILKSQINNSPLLDNLDDVRRFSRTLLSDKSREEVHVLFLDESYFLLSHECLQVGTVNHVSVYPREIMSRALGQNASHLILVHNHPGGSEKPSKEDIEMTKVLVQSASFLNISILDHIIIGRDADYSFRQNGLMNMN
ncbi:MAG: DNA repair protein RadC [Rhizobiaceae bacterium]|nr:DNA repair protein RadC [Rhizobiaceae bacterium]